MVAPGWNEGGYTTVPEVAPQTARALLGASAVPSPRCPAPGCSRPLNGRQRACSGRCRAALSRGRRQKAMDEKQERLAELLRLALRIVEAR